MTARLRAGYWVAAAVVLAAGVAGCGGGSDGGGVDAQALDYQLADVLRLAKLAEGFEFDVHVDCVPTDPGHFSCRVDALKPGYPPNSWTEEVTCDPDVRGDVPRCTSASGYALQ